MTKSLRKKVSIITVVFNDFKGIEKTIKSVLAQDYKSLEFIIVDGNSTDGTVDIVKNYLDDVNVFISEPDQGIYDAMNKGAKMAQGEYLFFLNSGDYFYDDRVLKDIDAYLEKGYDLIVGVVNRIYEGYIVIVHGKNISIQAGQMPPHQGSFIKKSIFNELDGYETNYKSSGDLDFFCRFFLRGSNVINIERNIAFMPSGGMSSNKSISVNETYRVIKKHFGKYCAYKYYLQKMLIEQGFKKILLFFGMRSAYEKLVKFKMKGK